MREGKLDRGARNAADVALEVGVAADDLEAVAAADDADREHAGGVNELARDVDRHVADGLPASALFPVVNGAEVDVVVERAGAGYETIEVTTHGATSSISSSLHFAPCASRCRSLMKSTSRCCFDP